MLLLAAEGLPELSRPAIEALMGNIVRAVEVPGAGHWLPQENPAFVAAELLAFFEG